MQLGVDDQQEGTNDTSACLGSRECFFFVHSPLGIAVIETETGIILNANESYLLMLGRSAEEVLGKTWMSFTPESEYLREIGFYRDIFVRKAAHFSYRKQYIKPDGKVFSVSIKAAALDLRPGRRRHVVMIYDIEGPPDQSTFVRSVPLQTLHIARDAVINALVSLSLFRDRETGEHLHRTKLYVNILLELGVEFVSFSKYGREIVSNASMLHDIGKVGIPDAILLKKGKLDDDEMRLIKNHTSLGVKALRESMESTGYDASLLFARDIIQYHHERWDGTGYPFGLKGEQIPFLARVMALADVYDALRSERPYKKPMSHESALRIIVAEGGSHFDPRLVALFLANEGLFNQASVLQPGHDLLRLSG